MNTGMKRIVCVVVIVVMAFGAVGLVSAQGPDEDDPGRGLREIGVRSRIGLALWQTVQEQTGLDRIELIQMLRDGKTLADICTENDVDPNAVIAAVTEDVTTEVNEAVADGKITQERADTILETLEPWLDEAMNSSLDGQAIRQRVQDHLQESIGDSLIGALAEAAGVEPRDLLREWLTPPTLSELAEEYGIDPNTVIDTAEAAITDQINQAVSDGKITQEQADQVLEGLRERLENRMNNPIGQWLRDFMHDHNDWPGILRDRLGGQNRPGMRGPLGGRNRPGLFGEQGDTM